MIYKCDKCFIEKEIKIQFIHPWTKSPFDGITLCGECGEKLRHLIDQSSEVIRHNFVYSFDK